MKNAKRTLDKKFQKVLQTPENFSFYVAIHDFVDCIEKSSTLSSRLKHRTAINKDLKLPGKYGHLKQIYQGIKDSIDETTQDLGHDRYMTICDLRRIKNNEFSESNTFWKKRETFRRLATEVHERLTINLSPVAEKK